jgi:hypothetical protein
LKVAAEGVDRSGLGVELREEGLEDFGGDATVEAVVDPEEFCLGLGHSLGGEFVGLDYTH